MTASRKQDRAAHGNAPVASRNGGAKRILFIMDRIGSDDHGPEDRGILSGYADLTRERIEGLDPDVVASPLFAGNFDCFDVARLLIEAEFTGCYRVFTGPLPKPGLVIAELESAFPQLHVELMVLPSLKTAHANLAEAYLPEASNAP